MSKPRYGVCAVGPPGSGKTTFCNGIHHYMSLLGREACVLNFDPANETLSVEADDPDTSMKYDCAFDICEEIVSLSSVMEQTCLGPNGGLVYCMEYLANKADDVIGQILSRISPKSFLILDLPGQAELYTHSTCVQTFLSAFCDALQLRLTMVQLIDAHYCMDANQFLSAALLGTTTMLRLELPTVNVLSKVDLLKKYDDLPLQLDFFTECQELHRLLPFLNHQPFEKYGTNDRSENGNDEPYSSDAYYADDPEYMKARQARKQSKLHQKHLKLHKAIAEVVDDYSLISFLPLDISNAESVGRVLARIDKCNGYVFSKGSINENMFSCAVKAEHTTSHYEADTEVRDLVKDGNL